eukprot:CAMPEP_0117623184 /NCGR_PEP_ID=MMETSP0784-20121206/88519_1 /TAXON_ID=39447 /ORGANISM="" /LENGTH=333 /DNA_ID=CAMNT_0005427133 /DNA_START=122 /DNA_END=1123 /DNA_ORIENTATION=+
MNGSLMRQLYRGVLPPLLTTGAMTGAMNSIHFSLFEYFRTRAHNSNFGVDKNDIATIGICGAVSGMMVTIGTNPISIIKIRQQIASEKGMGFVIKDIYHQSGIKGFYRGFGAMLPLDACRGMYFVMYELFKAQSAKIYNEMTPKALSYYLDYESRQNLNHEDENIHKDSDFSALPVASSNIFPSLATLSFKWGRGSHTDLVSEDVAQLPVAHTASDGYGSDMNHENEHTLPSFVPLSISPNDAAVRVFSSGLAGVCCWFLYYPIDVVKSRVHLDFSGIKYSGVLDCAVKTFREGGIAAFYRGMSFTLIRAAPVAAATLTTYETVKDILHEHYN